MRNAYNRRPKDFKRRILSRIYTSREDTFLKESNWLNLIKKEELKIRYYNFYINQCPPPNNKGKKRSEKHCLNLSLSQKGKPKEKIKGRIWIVNKDNKMKNIQPDEPIPDGWKRGQVWERKIYYEVKGKNGLQYLKGDNRNELQKEASKKLSETLKTHNRWHKRDE